MNNKYEKIAIETFGQNYRRNKVSELIFYCPKCNRIKLYVNTVNGVYHCFRCNYKGRLKLRTSLLDVKDKYNLEKLQNTFNSTTKETNNELKLIHYTSIPLNQEQKHALYNRGLTDSDIKFYNISGRLDDNRIQIPNFVKGCFTDIVCAWQYDKTKITDKNPKYLNSEGTKKDKTLFNIYNIEQNTDKIILTEGIFNAITAGKNAVASYGCHLSDIQCQLILQKEPKSILIAYDSDEPGVLGSLDVIQKLKNNKYKGIVEYILLPIGLDINDIGHNNFINYYNSHKVVIDLHNIISSNLPKLLYDSKN